MTLHTFNKPYAFSCYSWLVQPDDQVLFIEDGVYCALQDLPLAANQVHLLEPDVVARGLEKRISSDVSRVSYDTFVSLCCEADSVSNWY